MTATTQAIARATLDGFNLHYALFRDCARTAKRYFEAGNWLAIAHTSQDRINFYDRRVAETVSRLEREFDCAHIDEARWEEVKRHYIALVIDHKQPECAETFFNSVSCKILHRTYFHNRCLFVRPAVSTEHIDADPPSYRSYYPRQHGLRHALIDIVLDFRLEQPFGDFRRDLVNMLGAFRSQFPRPFRLEANHQIQVLSSLFFRNRTAYVIGRIVNGYQTHPFAVPIKHGADGKLYVDALLLDRVQIALLFSANRAYFLVDMEVPSAYVGFLHQIATISSSFGHGPARECLDGQPRRTPTAIAACVESAQIVLMPVRPAGPLKGGADQLHMVCAPRCPGGHRPTAHCLPFGAGAGADPPGSRLPPRRRRGFSTDRGRARMEDP